MTRARRNWQLIAFLGLALLAIVLVDNNRSQGERITRIERPDCTSQRDKAYCERVFNEVINNASPAKLRALGTRIVVASSSPGATGKTGAAGKTGKTGAAGKTGTTGATGATGATGLRGPAGPQGARGPRGAQGPKGEQGERGAPGVNADTNAVVNEVLARLCRINPLLC